MSSAVGLAALLAAASWGGASRDALGADAERGRLLHDTHCVSCHGTQVYKRDSKVATNYAEIHAQVVRWETNLSLNWSAGDVDAVATYLARTFYRRPCPDC
ncbi:MAG TPA: cytochrome C [Burkholderiales bacterium]|nr:cytochrome C [Burkholderiales bacterium]